MDDLSSFQHPRFARTYERLSTESERRGTAAYRERLLTGLTGKVIEVGAGYDAAAAIREAGFRIEDVERFAYRPLRAVPRHAHVLGGALR